MLSKRVEGRCTLTVTLSVSGHLLTADQAVFGDASRLLRLLLREGGWVNDNTE